MAKDLKDITILAIESSCDDTSAAIMINGELYANITSGQSVHKEYGGVVPELASRAHQQHIIPVVHSALNKSGIKANDINTVAFTRGPGLLGSLLVGTSFAKGFALANDLPLVEVNHMQAHILAHFIRTPGEEKITPKFPFLCLTVSGGHTQIVVVRDHLDMEVVGETLDDAAGEAFDKAAKIMGLPYPGGPLIDKYGKEGNPDSFEFTIPKINGLNFSFSGLKTSFLYFLRDRVKENPDFVQQHQADLAASIQHTIVESLLIKLREASKTYGIHQIAIAGGVSANSYLREKLKETSTEMNWDIFIPPFEYCTDNAAMIAMAGHFKALHREYSDQTIAPMARLPFQ